MHHGDSEDDEPGADGLFARPTVCDDAALRVPCRLPNDPAPFPEQQLGDSEARSFPSVFAPVNVTEDDSLTAEELRHAWSRLNSLIRSGLAQNTPAKELVSQVKTFYDRVVRTQFEDADEWIERDVYSYIYGQHAAQADAAIDSVAKTIEFLRSNLGYRDSSSDVIKPNVENIKLIMAAAKTHSQLVDAKRKRDVSKS